MSTVNNDMPKCLAVFHSKEYSLLTQQFSGRYILCMIVLKSHILNSDLNHNVKFMFSLKNYPLAGSEGILFHVHCY